MKLEYREIDEKGIVFSDADRKKTQHVRLCVDNTFFYRNHRFILHNDTIYELARSKKERLNLFTCDDKFVNFTKGDNKTILERTLCRDGHFNFKNEKYRVINDNIVKL